MTNEERRKIEVHFAEEMVKQKNKSFTKGFFSALLTVIAGGVIAVVTNKE